MVLSIHSVHPGSSRCYQAAHAPASEDDKQAELITGLLGMKLLAWHGGHWCWISGGYRLAAASRPIALYIIGIGEAQGLMAAST